MDTRRYPSYMGPIGVPELLILLAVLLIIFGPKRLPQLGRQLGTGMREFKDSISSKVGDDDEDDDRPSITAATPSPQASSVKAPEDAAEKAPRP